MIIDTPTNWMELTMVMIATETAGLLNHATFSKPRPVMIVFSAPCWYWKMK